jgi:AraC-like DNA-binding protein
LTAAFFYGIMKEKGTEAALLAKIYKDKRSFIVQNAFVDFKTGELLSPIETEHYTVVQVAQSYFIGGFESNTHRQLCDLEITLAVTGALFSSANGKEERVQKGEAYLSFRGEAHGMCAKASCRFLTLAVNIKEGMRPLLEALTERFSSERTLALSSDAAVLLSRIADEFSGERRPFFEEYLDALIGELLIALARPEAPASFASVEEDSIAAIMNYIDGNYLSICSPEELSRFGYSYHYIVAKFRARYGVSPGAYLFSKRMDHAKGLLLSGQSVARVSQALGYSSPYNFSRAFKKHFGYPPSQSKARPFLGNSYSE